ncbi:MAG TPA: site-2 protease family protein [Candidatus Polarisedimenticolia bacterium]|nr:site-2 protease family protein [Candidatus Polarisedimenticolia bacterium]
MQPLDPGRLADLGIWFVVFLFSTTLHEAAHALLARLGGDDTAYLGGQVTLNPMPHIRREPFGMVLVPLISFWFAGFVMGWASTPFDPDWARRHPGRQALMSAAGPAANLLLSLAALGIMAWLLLGGVMVRPGSPSFERLVAPSPVSYGEDSLLHPAAAALSITFALNLLLFLFNLLPLPPLDGSGVVEGLFPSTAGRLIAAMRANPMMGLLGLLVAWQVIGALFRPVLGFLLGLLWAFAG